MINKSEILALQRQNGANGFILYFLGCPVMIKST
jgi:hypothetical protein